MFALLHKDFLLLRKEPFLIFALVLALLGGAAAQSSPASSLVLLLLPAYFAAAYANSYEYKYGAEALLATLPPGRRALVLGKYLLALIASGVVVLIAGAARALLGLFFPAVFPWRLFVLALGLDLLYFSVSLAAYFRFGYLRSRWVTFLLFATIGGVAGFLGSPPTAKEFPGLLSGRGSLEGLSFLLLGLGLALFLMSGAWSLGYYRRKELY